LRGKESLYIHLLITVEGPHLAAKNDYHLRSQPSDTNDNKNEQWAHGTPHQCNSKEQENDASPPSRKSSSHHHHPVSASSPPELVFFNRLGVHFKRYNPRWVVFPFSDLFFHFGVKLFNSCHFLMNPYLGSLLIVTVFVYFVSCHLFFSIF
jgi:hypothetical protein